MSTSDKLNRLIQIKTDLKNVLLSKGVITSSTPFTDYPVAVNKLSKPVEMATLNFAFDNKYWVNLLSGDLKYGTSSKYKSYFIIDGVDRWDLLDGKWIWTGTTQTSFTVSVQVPKNKSIKWELLAYGKTSKSEPISRLLYTDDFTNFMYNSKPETGTVTVTGTSKTVTMKIKYVSDAIYP
jgi:hypothetical protein